LLTGGLLSSLPYYASPVLTIVALVHYFKTRPDGYWFWVIIFIPTIGPLAYFAVNVVLPLFGAGGGTVEGKVALTLAERRRLRELEHKIEENALPYDYAQLGELLYRRRNYAKAEPFLRRAASLIRDEVEPRYWLALTLEQLSKPDEAADLLGPIVENEPRYKFGEAALAYARALEKAGRLDQALAAYDRVLRQSTFTEGRVRCGLLLAARGQTDRARQLLEQAVREARDLPRHNLRAARPFVRQAKSWLAGHPR